VAETARRRHRVGLDVALLRRVDSTNRLAWSVRRELAEDEIEVNAAIVAFEQSAGRGRQGRTWESPAGRGVYATVCGRLEDPRRLGVLPLAAAVAVAEVLDRILPVPCRLKWPNDVMVKGRKLAGILVEAAVRAGSAPEVVVGLGLNHGQGQRELATPAATSLAIEMTEPPALATVAWDLVEALERELHSTATPEVTVARWMSRSLHRPGEVLRCRRPDGEVVGSFVGLTAEGLLRLNVDGREEVLVSAEVGEP
jgi:BirA family biotin operon repressor/biotin-[acetyl-CoA-carboxylase] ligase